VSTPERTLLRLAQGYQLSQALYVAAKLGVADVLVDGPVDADTVAQKLDVRADELRRVLRALVAAGVFTEHEDGGFALNDAAAALRADAPGRVRDVVINFGEEMYRAFGELLRTVRTGETAFDAIYGKPLFAYYSEHAEVEASGSARMLARTLPVAREVADSDVMAGARSVVDVGGGPGTMMAEALRRHPALRAVLLDRPGVLELARRHLAEREVLDRCELVDGDFFRAVPRGGDVYVLKSVLHDWPDDRCVQILGNCRRAMGSDARLAIIEYVLPARASHSQDALPALLLDLIMLTYSGGRERTKAEYAQLLDRAELRLVGVSALQSGPSVLQALPA
jgi:O-methyltransferase domain/Dimerisation domain